MPETTLPTADQAFNHLFTNVHSQVFFQKLASHGIPCSSEADARDLLGLAETLRQVPQAQAKQASAYGDARTELAQALQARGLDGGLKQAASQEHDLAVKQAAELLAQDPAIYNSVLSLKAAQAGEVAKLLTPAKA